MSTTYSKIFKLPLTKKLELLEDLWDSIAAHPEQVPLPDLHHEELDRREQEQSRNLGPEAHGKILTTDQF